MEPAGERERHDVQLCEDVLADSKGVELPQGILPLPGFAEDLLCVGSKFQQVVKDCAQVLIFCNNLHRIPMDIGDDCQSQFPLLVGEGHYHLYKYKLMKS